MNEYIKERKDITNLINGFGFDYKNLQTLFKLLCRFLSIYFFQLYVVDEEVDSWWNNKKKEDRRRTRTKNSSKQQKAKHNHP